MTRHPSQRRRSLSFFLRALNAGLWVSIVAFFISIWQSWEDFDTYQQQPIRKISAVTQSLDSFSLEGSSSSAAARSLQFANTTNSTTYNTTSNIIWIHNDLPPPPEPRRHHRRPSSNREVPRFVFFKFISNGQGAGNHLQGMLAAHLFGLEFNRTVCVFWADFWKAFAYSDEAVKQGHDKLCQGANSKLGMINKWFSLWNYAKPVNECKLVDTLSSDQDVVAITANTYPAWRTDIPNNFFFRFFKARPELLETLPYRQPPKVVVHFRSPDGPADGERGLDEESLTTLGDLLRGNSTYLVTNRPDFYKRFETCCGWSYDHSWGNMAIRHGVLNLRWTPEGQQERPAEKYIYNGTKLVPQNFSNYTEGDQNLKLWSDWYTMLTAETVYHSNSDFSRSAVHWSNGTGHQLTGMKTVDGKRVLDLRPAPYDEVPCQIPPLVERKRPAEEESNQTHDDDDCCEYLRHCNSRKGFWKSGRDHKPAKARTRKELMEEFKQQLVQQEKIDKLIQEKNGNTDVSHAVLNTKKIRVKVG